MPPHVLPLRLVSACPAFAPSRPTPLGPALPAVPMDLHHQAAAADTRDDIISLLRVTPLVLPSLNSSLFPLPIVSALISSFNMIPGFLTGGTPGPPQSTTYMESSLHRRTLNGISRRVPNTAYTHTRDDAPHSAPRSARTSPPTSSILEP
ncbi:hypothetical protein B0H14DRAFT_3466023 [Mycena olivaceomarginata]|nr:hypothetical protein B0H14DRAFT_3466023 [Mycena olivaceomarginata]